MVPDRVEEELFGTEDRTGGPRKVGALEEAHGGTLYIDEVADMPLETQGKILRVLVEQKFLRLGGSQKVAVDVRIISSTSRDLEREMAEGAREDLITVQRVRRVPSFGSARYLSSSTISSSRSRKARASRRAGSERTPSLFFRPTTGRATCVN